MSASLIAVGSELVRYGRSDGNGDWLCRQLNRMGIEVEARSQIDDDVERIAASIRLAREQSDIVLLTGGIGPTDDDRTREGLALALGRPLLRDPTIVARIREGFESRGLRFTPDQERQADRPRGSDWLENRLGAAPGILDEQDGVLLAAMPGVPHEMRAMFEVALLPALVRRPTTALATRSLGICGRSESGVDRKIRDLYSVPGADITILGSTGGIELHLRARAAEADEARKTVERMELEIRDRLGEDIYGTAEDDLAEVVGRGLQRAGFDVACAESCTAGLLGASLTRPAGASSWFRGGLLVYQDRLKIELADVAPATLDRHGAVSDEVALELANGARRRCMADLGVGISGIAGPGGGTREKPVGRVHIALAWENGSQPHMYNLPGDREAVRLRSVTLALDAIRRWVLARQESPES